MSGCRRDVGTLGLCGRMFDALLESATQLQGRETRRGMPVKAVDTAIGWAAIELGIRLLKRHGIERAEAESMFGDAWEDDERKGMS